MKTFDEVHYEKYDIFRLLPSSCLNWKIYCDDHSSPSFLKYITFRKPHSFGVYRELIKFNSKLRFLVFCDYNKFTLNTFYSRISLP